ncbi:mechanosensitive ion channel [Helicobacter sp. faydin-H20]|uniref:small-conductance mechanosensitive channel MscS n=1 Tax=Helicobacter anatolicus TaxID=2905874 RepID=UPI001E5076B7|nr:mechanosensitive ion channel domain-containing protein [Helicobacter anatolicus]MCE3037105.1 mechanosensitive ion channel [Helicobacter anatolicus]
MEQIKLFLLSHLPLLQSLGIAILKALLIAIFGWYFASFFRKKIYTFLKKKDEILANFIAQLIFVLCFLVAMIAALGALGIQTTSILTILGTAGVAIALALKDSLSSIAGGIVLIVLRPFKKGDTIEINNLNGSVESLNLFNTSIRLPDGRLAILPNKHIANANIINSTSEKRRIEWICGVGYQSDIEIVRHIIKDVIASMDKIDKTMAPFVGITDLGPNSLNFTIRVWAKLEDGIFGVRSELIERIKIAFDQNNIEIPYNKLDISIKKESE